MIAAGLQSANALEFHGDSCAVTAGSANLKISAISETDLVVSLKDAPTVAEVPSVSAVHTVVPQNGYKTIQSEQQLEIKDQNSRTFKLEISEEEEQLRTCTPSDDSFKKL